MKIVSTLCTLVFALALSLPSVHSAERPKSAEKTAESAKKEETKGEAKKDHYPLYGQIVSITSRTLTIKGGEGKPDRKFDITKNTVIKKDDKAATTKDAMEGQWVGGYVKKTGGQGNDEILSLNLSPKQKEVKSEEKKPGTTSTPRKKK